MKTLVALILILLSLLTMKEVSQAQSLPFKEIPASPDNYTPGKVFGRMVDGLGFRYYWATEGLNDKDLQYKPSAQGRTMLETLTHIHRLSLTIAYAAQNKVNKLPAEEPPSEYTELRKQTLQNLLQASELFKKIGEAEVKKYQVVFESSGGRYEFPLWNLINGQISDALWHTGQVVLMRRATGNPINSKVDVFTGKLKD